MGKLIIIVTAIINVQALRIVPSFCKTKRKLFLGDDLALPLMQGKTKDVHVAVFACKKNGD